MSAQQIKLISSDGVLFNVPMDVAFKCETINEMCENLGFTDGFEMYVSAADAVTLKKVLEYCETYKYKPKGKNEDKRIILNEAQEKYLDVPNDFLMKMITAADFLNIPGLLDIMTQKLANIIEGKTPEEMRQIFMQPDDLTVEEKQEVQKKWEWLEMENEFSYTDE